MERGGQPGNQNATKEHRLWASALNRAIAQDDGKRLRDAAEKLLDQAANGESWAIKELADRLDGRPAQAVTLSGDKDSPIATSMTVTLVKADAQG